MDQVVPTVRSVTLSGVGSQGPSVSWQLKAAAEPSLFDCPNTKKKIQTVNQAKNFFSYVLKLVFMLIELLRRSDANVVNKDVTEHVLC